MLAVGFAHISKLLLGNSAARIAHRQLDFSDIVALDFTRGDANFSTLQLRLQTVANAVFHQWLKQQRRHVHARKRLG